MGEYNASYLLGSYQVIEDLIQNDQNLQVKTTYPRHIPGNTNYNLVVILSEDNKLDPLNINELAHYLTSHGIVTSSIKFKSKTNKLSLKELVSNNVKELSKYFNKKAYNISHVAILGNNINPQLPDYYNINYEPTNILSSKLPMLVITSNTCNTSWEDLEKVVCINLKGKFDVKELYSQIKFWLQIQLTSCPLGFIKTADAMFGNVICEPFPKFAADEVLFPFHPKHPVYCTQGNLNKFPYSHFFQNTMYAIDLASPKGQPPGKIYSSFAGVAYIYDKCKVNNNINGTLDYCGYGYGNYVYVLRADGVFASYAHLDKIYIKNKQLVKKGELIGLEGSTGLAGSRHLHFSLHLLGADSDFFNVHTKGHVTIPFWLKIKRNNDTTSKKVISYDLVPSLEELIYGDWE